MMLKLAGRNFIRLGFIFSFFSIIKKCIFHSYRAPGLPGCLTFLVIYLARFYTLLLSFRWIAFYNYFDNVRLSAPPPTPLLVKGLCPFTSTHRSAAYMLQSGSQNAPAQSTGARGERVLRRMAKAEISQRLSKFRHKHRPFVEGFQRLLSGTPVF
jgi:hypothetical protein